MHGPGGVGGRVRSEKAVVLGCGVAGMAAAAALRRTFAEVVIIERDWLPAAPTPRRGVPQGEQLHNILGRAQRHLEDLFPGFREALLRAGCGDASVSDETHVFELGVRMPERKIGLRLMCAWRPTIESVARRILLDGGGITIREGTRAEALLVSGSGDTAGVVVRADRSNEEIGATVVVDAMGSGSKAPQWLESTGARRPPVDTQKVGQWYSSMLFERPAGSAGVPDFWLTFPTPPRTRGALVSPVSPDHWYVSVSGRSRDQPPRDAKELLAYAATVEDPVIGELLAGARPSGIPHLFRRHDATWRRYDRLECPLTGFLPIGDSVATLNPLFGQGMSVATWQAAALADLMDPLVGVTRDRLTELTAAYLSRSADACQAAWTLGAMVDPPAGRGGDGAGQDQLSHYSMLAKRIDDDAEVHRKYVGMWHLIDSAEAFDDLMVSAPGADPDRQLEITR
jgi:2-polyprenyl-6-methoxyphenol hydroxylase-like FAD-dependent oxidoreductase